MSSWEGLTCMANPTSVWLQESHRANVLLCLHPPQKILCSSGMSSGDLSCLLDIGSCVGQIQLIFAWLQRLRKDCLVVRISHEVNPVAEKSCCTSLLGGNVPHWQWHQYPFKNYVILLIWRSQNWKFMKKFIQCSCVQIALYLLTSLVLEEILEYAVPYCLIPIISLK